MQQYAYIGVRHSNLYTSLDTAQMAEVEIMTDTSNAPLTPRASVAARGVTFTYPLKKDTDVADPASYRLIALECCLLKMLTLIIDRRIREGAEDIGAIPVTQNGFQDELRTNENVFVLLNMIDKADSLDVPLHVAYLDLKNAFPQTDRPTLWVKLAKLGISGPLIEWLKCLYERIRYVVRLEGQFAPMFKSLLGILTGDPGSRNV